MLKKIWYLPLVVILMIIVIKIFDLQKSPAQFASPSPTAEQLEVTANRLQEKPYRIGVNLGRWTTWGSEQFGKNLIHNPGFEAEVDRLIVFVTRSDSNSFSDESNNDYSDGKWDGATWEVRTGSHKGASGKVTQSKQSGIDGLPQYFSDTPVPSLGVKDVIVLTKIRDGGMDKFWDISSPLQSRVTVDKTEARPGSPGSQSIKVAPQGTEQVLMNAYFDNDAKNIGKMIKVEGKWRFSVWMKALDAGRITVSFKRTNSPDWFYEYIYPTKEWQEYTIDFDGTDEGVPHLLHLRIRADGGTFWLDDIAIGPVEEQNNTPFRQVVIDSLKELRPSFIRTVAYFGDTFENRTAEPFARKSWVERLMGNDAGRKTFSFAYQDIFDLCALTNANPWIVVPTTLSYDEYYQLGQFLSQHAPKSRFSEVIVEFGNENWNWIFRPQAYPYYQQHGLVAQPAFENIRLGAGDNVNLRTMLNGQHANTWITFKYADSTPNADSMSIAPYFLDSLDSGTPDNVALELLFANDGGLMEQIAKGIKERGKTFSVYEVNMHTAKGSAPGYERDRVTNGAASGSALAKRIIKAMQLGYDPVVVYTLSQYHTNTWDIRDNVKLWGVTRDFGPPTRYRPTGLAMIMLNRILAGEMFAINPLDASSAKAQKLTMAAFKPSDTWGAAIVSENNEPVEIELRFPDDGHPMPSTYMIMQAATPFETNEVNENVQIVEKSLQVENRTVRLTVPAWGLAVVGTTQDTTLTVGETTGGGTSSAPAPSEPPPTEPTPTQPVPTEPTPTQPAPTEPTPSEPVPTEPTPTETTPTEPAPTTPSGEPSIDDLRQKVQELQQKQEEILRDLQELIQILGNNTWTAPSGPA